MTQMLIGPLRYGGTTVPGMRVDGERLVGSRAIMRRLDELAPEPPLLPPPGDERYAPVLEAERWGDEVLQSVPRRIHRRGVPAPPARDAELCGRRQAAAAERADAPATPLTAKLMAFRNKARDDERARGHRGAARTARPRRRAGSPRACSAASSPTPRTCRSASTIRLLMSIGDVRPLIEGRPAAKLVTTTSRRWSARSRPACCRPSGSPPRPSRRSEVRKAVCPGLRAQAVKGVVASTIRDMTAREHLHRLVDELSETEAEHARVVVEDTQAADRKKREIDRAIVASYTHMPQDPPDEWGDLPQQTDVLMSEAMRELDAEEHAAGFPPWQRDSSQ